MYKVLDISYYQRGIVLKDIKNDDGYIFRGAIGSTKTDASLSNFTSQAISLSLPFGLYTASYAKNAKEADGEAIYICEIALQYKNYIRLPIFFDFEYFSSDYILENFGVVTTKSLVWALTEAYCEKVKEYGFTAGVYTNLDYYNRFYTKEFFDKHPDYWFWYARPGLSAPDKECDIWQYASNNGLSDFNYNGDIDKNVLYSGFLEPNTDPQEPPVSPDLTSFLIGFASAGDVHIISSAVKKLGVTADTTSKSGYIITGPMSSGDQKAIISLCESLYVPCIPYDERESFDLPEPPENDPVAPDSVSDQSCLEKIWTVIKDGLKKLFGLG